MSANQATGPSSLGNTSRPSTTNSTTWARNASPSWNATIVSRSGHRRVADPERHDVDGQEAAAVQARCDAVAERAVPIDATGANGASSAGSRGSNRARRTEDGTDHEADPQLLVEEPRDVAEAVSGSLDPGDQADRERNRHWVVRPDSAARIVASRGRSSVNRSVAKTAAASVEPMIAPSRNAFGHEKPNRWCAAAAPAAAVISTPTVLSTSTGASRRRISGHASSARPRTGSRSGR